VSDLNINPEKTKNILVEFLHTGIEAAGFHRAVVGLSGGIDSTVSCFLAVSALGKKNVLGIRMPYKTSSRESLDHAQLVIDQLGIESKTIEITPMVEPLIEKFPDMDAFRKGNIMARQRMIVLYDQSADSKGLVIGTGNKTEIILGYTTLFGDSACALNPIGDLYKTQVRQLAGYLGVPYVIIQKPPSADLWTGQTDEGEMGITYESVDRLFFMLVEQGKTVDHCLAAGFTIDFVGSVFARARRNRFKRALPPIASLSGKPLNEAIFDQEIR
jgi:NAD+ synthase